MTDRYRPAQVLLHWFTLLGVVVQIAIHDPIERATSALAERHAPDPSEAVMVLAHVILGTAVFVAVLARLWLRYRHGAPGHAPGTSPVQAAIARAVHAALYGLLLLIGLSGMATRAGAGLGAVHFAAVVALVVLVGLHAAAALYNQFIRKDGTLDRMRPR